MGNRIGKEMPSKLQDVMRSKPNLVSLCGIADDATEADFSGLLDMDADDAIILASELPDKRALTSLHVGKNRIPEKEMREIMAITMCMDSMKILCEIPFKDKTLAELDVSGKNLSMEGALVVAEYLDSNEALLCLDMSNNNINFNFNGEAAAVPGKALSDALAANTVLTKLDLSNNHLKPEFARELAVGIRDNGAMTSLHVGMNRIPEEEMREIMAIAMRMDSMKILCEIPFKDKTLAELDVSGKNLSMEGALVVAEYLDGNGALTSLDISDNSLYAVGAKLLAEALSGNQIMTELNVASNRLGEASYMAPDMSGVITLAGTIKDMGALSSLNLSSNKLTGSLVVTWQVTFMTLPLPA
jgi:Leucine-rich repeat (LRR) protein